MMATTTLTIGGDLEVYRFGFGAMRITGDGIWGEPPDEAACRDLLRRIVQTDVNLIDTADSYGPEVSERLIAEALYPYPDNLVIATKGGLERPGPNRWVRQLPARAAQALLRGLAAAAQARADRPVPAAHGRSERCRSRTPSARWPSCSEEGKIRHIGLSNVNAEQLERAQEIVPIVSVQNRYNVADRESEEVLASVRGERPGVLSVGAARKPRSQQSGAGRRPARRRRRAHGATPGQVALAWLLHRSPVILPIPGTSSIAHFEENLEAVELELDQEELDALEP